MFTDGEEVTTILTLPMHTDPIEVIDYATEAICGE